MGYILTCNKFIFGESADRRWLSTIWLSIKMRQTGNVFLSGENKIHFSYL